MLCDVLFEILRKSFRSVREYSPKNSTRFWHTLNNTLPIACKKRGTGHTNYDVTAYFRVHGIVLYAVTAAKNTGHTIYDVSADFRYRTQ